MIAIVDYGMGNLRSVEKAFVRLGQDVIITNNKSEIEKADKLVIPGVGNFKKGMNNLKELDLIEVLNERVVNQKVPVLGICLGMQLFTKHSEEGFVDGLGWIDAETIQLKFEDRSLKVPHIGWNTIEIENEIPLLNGIDPKIPYYFVHSFSVHCNDTNCCAAKTFYGKLVDTVIFKNNIVGTQFHPEKSHDVGMKLIENFIHNY